MLKRVVHFALVLTLLSALVVLTVRAGERTISINGDGNAVWFISGESTLVMNGFDLASFGVANPAFIDRVSLGVDTPVPGATTEVVIYEDANGGSPVDAVLVGRTTVTISQAGVFTAVFPAPVQVNQRAVWVGFYLPVNFRFQADTSGSSVLTYWAWTPSSTFDLANLSSAAVFGPSDGSAPVNIQLNGKARISFEVSSSAAGAGATPLPQPGVVPTTAPGGPFGGDLSVMVPFPNCQSLLYDSADERVTYLDRINLHCNLANPLYNPPAPQGYDSRAVTYDVYIFGENGNLLSGRLQFPITYCLRPDSADLPTAVIGVAWGAPRAWRVQPTQRFGDLICADVRRSGTIGYLVPNGQPTATPSF
jgi:hypothetical protein